MKNMKKIMIATITVASIAITASAFAERGEGSRQEKMMERVSSKLELTEEQSQALQSFAAELTETRQLMQGDGDGIRSEFGDLIGAEAFDQGQALELINERTAAIQANAPELVAAAALFFDGLSAEQKEQVQTFMEKGGRHRGEKGKKH